MVLALLFSQFALASYVCPTAAPQPAMLMAVGEPCESMGTMTMDEDQAVLCHQHCANLPQSFEPLQPPSIGPAAVIQVLLVPLVTEGIDAQAASFSQVTQARPPPDPLFLSTLRLRV